MSGVMARLRMPVRAHPVEVVMIGRAVTPAVLYGHAACVVAASRLTTWKLGTHARSLTAEVRSLGKRVHLGWVNSHRRLRNASAIGARPMDLSRVRSR
jgi:hypothetical protein